MAVRGTENFERVLPGKAECFSKRRDSRSVSNVKELTDVVVTINPIKTYGWECQVEVWGWPLPVDRKIRISLLGKIHYYRRVLERILNINAWTIGKGLQGNRPSKELMKAVEELQGPKEVKVLTSGKLEVRKNQHSEQQSEEHKGKTGRIGNEDPEPIETIKVKKDQVKEDREDAKELKRDGRSQIVTAEMIESQTVSDNKSTATGWFAREQLPSTRINEANTTRELLKLWMEHDYSTWIQEGLYNQLPKLGRGRYHCGKSRMLFPYWPPTSLKEAEIQFRMCFEERIINRRNLAHCWWRVINNFNPWTVSEPQQRYKDGQEEIRQRCPAVAEELRTVMKLPRRPRGWRCDYCELTLTERRCSCLCHCEQHRDQCPIHSY